MNTETQPSAADSAKHTPGEWYLLDALYQCAEELTAVELLMQGPEFAAARYNVRKRATLARAAIAAAQGAQTK